MSRLLALHLSDIHVHGSSDPILLRADKIAAAAQWVAEPTAALILVTGDFAFSGQQHQYDAVAPFFASLRTCLHNRLPTLEGVRFVFIPGNHDVAHEDEDTL